MSADKSHATPDLGVGLDEVYSSVNAGFGQALGFGRRPVIVVVDFTCAYTDKEGALGSDVDLEIEATRRLLDAARDIGTPIIFTAIAYAEVQMRDSLFVQKVPAMRELLAGTPAVEIDPRLAPRPDERVIYKEFASAFAATSLTAQLNVLGADSILIAGCSTSGCVRATVVDALQHGFVLWWSTTASPTGGGSRTRSPSLR